MTHQERGTLVGDPVPAKPTAVARPAPPRAQPADRLRDDVRLLGELVGQVLREQGGASLFEAVERVRTTAIRLRSTPTPDPNEERDLLRWIQRQSTPRLLHLARAFGVYFHLINLAEQQHRIRTLAERARAGTLDDSIESAVAALADRGVPLAEARRVLRALAVHSVFTAHPSEARRQTLLHHVEQATHLVARLDEPLPPRERRAVLDALRERITLVWQTAETRTDRPSVLDEVRSALHPLETTVYDIAPHVIHRLTEALSDAYGRRPSSSVDSSPASDAPRRLPASAPRRAPDSALNPLRFGTWVGGDRDGNPAVTPAITRAAARLARARLLRRYREDVEALGRDISVSARLIGASVDLLEAVERDRHALGLPRVQRWADEPYRRRLGLIAERLRRAEQADPGGYASADALAADLAQVERSLRAHGGARIAAGGLRHLQRRVEVFGFHLAELEIRQHADAHTMAVTELLGLRGVNGYDAQDDEARQATLEHALVGAPEALPAAALSADTRTALDTLRALRDIQRESGARACQTYIISMARAPADVLAVLYLAREVGLFTWDGTNVQADGHLDVVPLFETVRELAACGQVMDALYRCRVYRAALRARGNAQQVMVGYSDSNKDGGYFAATWGTYRAQQVLAEASNRAGVSLTVFHGRGGAVGRGGGPMERAVAARPPEARAPVLKVTVQGEVIFARFGHPRIAERHLEQVIHALLSSAAARPSSTPAAWVALAERLEADSRAAYETLVKHTPGFLDFFRQATPFPELGTLNLASRPVSRAPSDATLELENLRAIPWVFSWTQARVNLPGWYGLGTALHAAVERGHLSLLQSMYRDWPFFQTALDNAQHSLGTADMPTARRYATLAAPRPEPSHFRQVEAEYDRTVAAVLAVTGQHELLERSSILASAIKLRNPYVDALHVAQIALLRRYRALPADAPEDEREMLLDAIHHSINGIAAGLQTTG